MERRGVVRSSRPRIDTGQLFAAAVVPATAAMVGGLLLPAFQFPAAFLSAFVGKGALLALPLGLFGGLVGGACAAIADEGDVRWGSNVGATGFAVGGAIASLAGAQTPPTYGHLLVASICAGIGFALAAPSRPRTRIAVVIATSICMPVALMVAAPTCSLGGG